MLFVYLFLVSLVHANFEVTPLESFLTCNAPEASESDLRQACAVEMCGVPGTTRSFFDPAEFTVPKNLPVDVQKLDTRIGAVFDNWERGMNNYLDNLEKSLTAGKITAEKFLGVAALFEPYVRYVAKGTGIDLVVEPPPGASKAFVDGLNEWAQGRKLSAQYDLQVLFTLGMADSEDIRARMSQHLFAMKEAVLKLPESSNKTKILYAIKDLEEALARPSPTASMVQDIAGGLTVLQNILTGAKPSKPKVNPAPTVAMNFYDPDCKKACLAAVNEFIKGNQLKEMIKKTRERIKADKLKMRTSCASGMMYIKKVTKDYLQAVDAGKNKDFYTAGKLMLAQGVAKIKGMKVAGKPWLSEESGWELESFVNNVTVANEYPWDFLVSKSLQPFEEKPERAAPSLNVAFGAGANLVPMFIAGQVPGNIYGATGVDCPSARIGITDFFLPATPSYPLLHLSPFSCSHPDGDGLSSAIHEMGHIFSHLVSEQKMSQHSTGAFLSMRKCVAGEDLVVKMRDVKEDMFGMDRITTEEDTADALMYKAFPFKDYPWNCTFLKPGEKGGYDPRFLDLAHREGDSHSGGLLRIIREYRSQRTLKPQSACDQLAKQYDQQVKIDPCL